MTPTTVLEQASVRHMDAWVWWIGTARLDGYAETPFDTDVRDHYYTARDALAAAHQEHQ